MDDKQKKYIKMTTEPVKKLVLELSVPTVISMLVTALYNIVDTFFVGQINTNATAGVGIILPVMSIIQAFGFFFGQGSGNFISRMLGAKKEKEAEEMATTGSFLAFLFGAAILVFGLLFGSTILGWLGAKPGKVEAETIQFATDYYRVILIGAPFMCVSCVLNNQLRFQGNAMFSMVGLVSGAILNCALDPLFIFGFKMEVLGAALATIISQFVSCVILYIGTLRSDSLKLKFRNFRPTLYNFKNICIGGAPSLFRQGLASVATIFLNLAAGNAAPAGLADASIAAFSVVSKIMMFAFSALLGFGQGFQPICGFNYGAKKYKRVLDSYSFCVRLGLVILLVLSALGFVFSEQLVAIFRDDAAVIEIGSIALRCQCCSFTLMAVVCMTNMLYQNIGKVVGATLLAVARQGLMFIPAVLILPAILTNSLWGVYLAQPAADLLAFALAVPLAIIEVRDLKKKEIAINAEH